MTLRGRALLAIAAAGLPTGCALVAGLSDHQPYPVVQVTAGADHACLLMRTGEVWCWGANDTGQLGHRSVDGGACTTACPAAPVEGVSGAVQVSAGAGFTCAVTGGGDVQCWGRNGAMELGRTVSTLCGMVPCDDTPAQVAGVSGAVQVSAGGGYACARTAAGAVMCWGDDTHGQLGTGPGKPPAAITPVAGIGKALDVSASLAGDVTCGATSTGTWCWGLADLGGTGHVAATPNDTAAADGKLCTLTPVRVPGIENAVGVRAGGGAGCAEITADGFVCWGYDGTGELGTKATTNFVVPSPVTALPAVAVLDLRADHACAVDATGNAWCWGASGMGALGTENGTIGGACDNNVHCQRKAQPVALGPVSQIAVGQALSVALLTDGTVWAWGMNDAGQLGHRPRSGGDGPCPASSADTCNGTPSRVQGPPP